MVATYLAVTGSLWAAFSALRIKTNDFIPVAPAIFTGGPGFQILTDALSAAGTAQGAASGEKTGQIKSAWSAVGRDLSGLVPGGYQARYLAKGVQLMDSDPYGSFLSFTGVPSWPLQ
jgi:hypothetical protein